MKRWLLLIGLLWAGDARGEMISVTEKIQVRGEVEGSAEYELSVDAEKLLDCLQKAVEPSRFIGTGKYKIIEPPRPLRPWMAEDCVKQWISVTQVKVESVDSCEDCCEDW
jgi:hypothetical protein